MVIREVQSGGSCKPEQYIICLLFGNNGVVIRIILYVGGRSWHRTSGGCVPTKGYLPLDPRWSN